MFHRVKLVERVGVRAEMSEEKSENPVYRYIDWLFAGNPVLVAMKFIWTGMYVTAFTTFNFVAGMFILGCGIVIWFVWNDLENWEIDLK
mgnify:CR=1 FL=1